MLKRLVFPLALFGALFLASSAYAGTRDRNRDRLPDRWEKQHHLSLKVKQTHKDQDRDGLDNMGEFRSHTDPRDNDSDNDGIRDATEHAGKVESFTNGVLVITTFDNTKLTGMVTDQTEVKCENETQASASSDGGDDGPGHDQGDDHGGNGGNGGNGGPDDDNGDDNGHNGDGGNSCAPDALKAGAIVDEADLKITSTGNVWDEIELR